jgi:hypothetical protein
MFNPDKVSKILKTAKKRITGWRKMKSQVEWPDFGKSF